MALDAFYDEVAREIQDKTLVPGVWAKAFEHAGGELDRARVLYIKYRVAQLTQEANEQSRQKRRAAREAIKEERARTATTEAQRHPVWRTLFYVGSIMTCGLLTFLALLVALGKAQDPGGGAVSISSFVVAAVFGFLTFVFFRAATSATRRPPPRPPEVDHRIG